VSQEPARDLALGALLDELADRFASRVVLQLAKQHDNRDRWLTTREAAHHLGMHSDNLRKLAAANDIPSEQNGPGCTRYFRLSELDRWRESGARLRHRVGQRLPRS
jgi:excisionase family DNA binding protein